MHLIIALTAESDTSNFAR